MESKKVTIYDVSKELGVSTATINRALNNKPKVSEDMRKRVVETADRMGYKPSRTASSLSRKPITIGIIIYNTLYSFIQNVEHGAQKAFDHLADYKVSGDIVIVDTFAQKHEIEAIAMDMAEKGYDGIVFVPPPIETEYDELIHKLKSKGIFVGTAVSDLSTAKRDISVRNNGIVAGRMAAQVLHWLVGDAPVALITGYRDSTVHKETIDGFMEYAQEFPLNFAGIYEHRDDPELAYYLAGQLVRERPDIRGLYFGSANSVTFCNRLIELDKIKNMKIVTSDIFPEIVDFINNGAVQATIFQNPFEQGRVIIEKVYGLIIGSKKPINDTIYLNPQLVAKSNLNLFI